MPWADSHCHLQDEYARSADAADQISRARSSGVERFVCVGTSVEASRAAVEISMSDPGIWATIGLHPHEASEGAAGVTELLDSLSADPRSRVVAVGECGLDYHYDHSPRDDQRAAFSVQVALARQRGLSLVVHTREAWDDTLSILQEVGVPTHTVIHCFTGGPAEMTRCVDIGAWISFSGIVTFKNAGEVRDAARLCPLDRMLVETDTPFLAPVPHRGRVNEPAYVTLVGEEIARLKGLDPAEVESATWRNTATVFRLPAT